MLKNKNSEGRLSLKSLIQTALVHAKYSIHTKV